MNQTLNRKPINPSELSLGRLLATIALFMITASGAVLVVWGNIDDLLAGKFALVPTLVAVALVAAFLGLLVFWGRFLQRHTRIGAEKPTNEAQGSSRHQREA